MGVVVDRRFNNLDCLLGGSSGGKVSILLLWEKLFFNMELVPCLFDRHVEKRLSVSIFTRLAGDIISTVPCRVTESASAMMTVEFRFNVSRIERRFFKGETPQNFSLESPQPVPVLSVSPSSSLGGGRPILM